MIGNYYFDIENDYETALVYYRRAVAENQCGDATRERLATCTDVLAVRQEGERLYVVPTANDHNWRNGVACGWAAAFFLPATAEVQADMLPGRVVAFADGTRRTIVSTRENEGTLIVFVDGLPLEAERMGNPVTVRTVTGPPPA